MKTVNSLSVLVFLLILGNGLGIAFTLRGPSTQGLSLAIAILAFLLASVVSSTLQVANQWDKAVVLRMGRFQALRGPGLFFIVPVVDTIVY